MYGNRGGRARGGLGRAWPVSPNEDISSLPTLSIPPRASEAQCW